ncbi:MAG: sterol desaturase family protein [Pseudomonadota bacterium]
MPDFPPPTTLAAPAFVLSVIWEWWAVKTGRAKGRYETKDAITSLAMGTGNLVVNTLTGTIALWMMMLAWPFRVIELPVTVWSFAACFVLYDLVYYWKHRLAHRMRWFWAEHVTHHSSTHYNLTTALRQPWWGPFSGLILLGWVMVLLGFHPAFVFFAGGINLVYQFWIHTEAIDRMPGWFEALFNTPSHHRVHHATNPRYLDANYAGVFIVWDKMFGSFVEERADEPPVYGIVKPVGSYNPIVLAYHELAGLLRDCASDGLRPRRWIGRFVNAPGWNPDGHHMRSKDLKAAYVAANPETAGQPGLPSSVPSALAPTE